jgi:SulP family sulfate permease
VSGPAAALNMMVLAHLRRLRGRGRRRRRAAGRHVELIFAFTLAGKLIHRVPESVLAGFLTGVGLTLLSNQIPEVLGFNYRVSDMAVMMTRPSWLHDVSWLAVAAGLFVAFLVVTTAQFRRFPAAIVGIGLITFVAVYLDWDIERVGAIPSSLPPVSVPTVPAERWLALLARVAPLALLAAAESLLTARAVDRMSGQKPRLQPRDVRPGPRQHRHRLFSGMPVTGVIVRSTVNHQSGGRTRLSSLGHALLLIVAIYYLSDAIAQVPLTALAGFLCVIAFRLIELRTLVHLIQTAWIEAAAFLCAAIGTATDHLFLGLAAGLVLHAVHVWLHPTRAATASTAPATPTSAPSSTAPRERPPHPSARRRRRPPASPLRPHRRPPHRPALTCPRATPPPQPLARAHPRPPHVPPTAYVHPKASVIGRVVLGDDVHVAADTSLRADEGSPFFIGAGSNVQDGVILHALKNRCVRVGGQPWAIYVGRNVSIAHDALVHGPCYIGDHTFIGFKAVVHDSVVGNNCYIGIGAVVVGVEIPDGRAVPHGAIVDSADAVDRLPPASEAHSEFNHDVVEVNRGLAAAYHRVRSDIHHHPAPPTPPPDPSAPGTASDAPPLPPLRPRDRF